MDCQRIRNSLLRQRITDANEASKLIKKNMTVAFSGLTSAGYPKAIPKELVKRKLETGEELDLTMISGSIAGELEDLMVDLVSRRFPMIESSKMRKAANNGTLRYMEQQICKGIRLLNSGALGKIDVAVVEALAITEEGHVIPTACVGLLPYLVEHAEEIIIEINTAQPLEFEGLHDVFLPGFPPNRKPIPLLHAAHRFGEEFVRVKPEKIKHIVMSSEPDKWSSPPAQNEIAKSITNNLLDFLESEYQLCSKLPPVQTGVGSLANNIVQALGESNFKDISFFCGAIYEPVMQLIEAGKVRAASTGSIQMTPESIRILKKMSDLKKILVLRNLEITNDSEAIGRLGILSLNSALEADIYGNTNSSHISGTHVVNGIGGGANFAQNSGLSVMLIPSTAKNKAISTIVPMTFHVDITEHDIDIMITEHGVADLRGKDDIARAQCIIQNCADPVYRERLTHYLKNAIKKFGGHHPLNPAEALEWFCRFKETGTMLD